MRPLLILALLASATTHAQFANRHFGIEAAPMRFTDSEFTTGLMATLDFGWYIENGFEVGGRVPVALFLTPVSNRQRVATGGQLYARYLFLEEELRPWAGLEIDVLYIFRDNPNQQTNAQVFFGPGVTAGVEYFVRPDVSIGARAMFTLYFGVNNAEAIRPGYGGTLAAQVYF